MCPPVTLRSWDKSVAPTTNGQEKGRAVDIRTRYPEGFVEILRRAEEVFFAAGYPELYLLWKLEGEDDTPYELAARLDQIAQADIDLQDALGDSVQSFAKLVHVASVNFLAALNGATQDFTFRNGMAMDNLAKAYIEADSLLSHGNNPTAYKRRHNVLNRLRAILELQDSGASS
jgi:hypothetical protein